MLRHDVANAALHECTKTMQKCCDWYLRLSRAARACARVCVCVCARVRARARVCVCVAPYFLVVQPMTLLEGDLRLCTEGLKPRDDCEDDLLLMMMMWMGRTG